MITKAVIASPAATPDRAPQGICARVRISQVRIWPRNPRQSPKCGPDPLTPQPLPPDSFQEPPGLGRIGDRAAVDGLGDLGERRRKIAACLIQRQRQPSQLRRQALRRCAALRPGRAGLRPGGQAEREDLIGPWLAGLLPAACRRAIDLGCGAGRHAVLLPGNIHGPACALQWRGTTCEGHRCICGRSECAPAWWSFGKCLPSVHAHDDFAQLPWTSVASFRIS